MSLATNPAPSQALRCGDRNHKASIARQRKAAGTTTPHQQAEAIAAIVRKRLSDGQAVPDLDRYNLTDAVWSELMAILDADELTAVADAAGGDDLDDGDDEPSLDEWTATLEDDSASIPKPQQTPHVAHGWRDHEPAIVHSLKWRDSDGIEHLHVIRADTLDEALVHVKKLKLCIAAAKSKTSEPDQPSTANSRPDWCHIHNVAMKQRGDESQGYWHSHKAADGWCRGKAKA